MSITHKATHRCIGAYRRDGDADYFNEQPCTALRFSDGSMRNTCGEPCSFVMGKGGSSEPDFGQTPAGDRCDPHAPDGDPEAPCLHLFTKSGYRIDKAPPPPPDRMVIREHAIGFGPIAQRRCQAKRWSLIESITNAVSGFGISVLIQMLIYPFFGILVDIRTNVVLVCIFTVVSIARGYFVRRFFNWLR